MDAISSSSVLAVAKRNQLPLAGDGNNKRLDCNASIALSLQAVASPHLRKRKAAMLELPPHRKAAVQPEERSGEHQQLRGALMGRHDK